MKKALAAAFPKFDEYQLAKYDRGGPIKLRDVLFLCHAKPRDEAQAGVWKKLIWGRLSVPDTWEVALSSGSDKREAWERLLREQKLGALALLRNLRNMREAGVNESLVLSALGSMSTARVLPFRFLAAARYAPQWEEALEQAMLKSVAKQEKLPGKTIVLVDVSGSMTAPLSRRSEMQRTDAAYGLAVLLREIGEKVAVFSFSNDLVEVPARRGFALRDAIDRSQQHGATYLGKAVEKLNQNENYDRLIVITDEQAHDTMPSPKGKGYVINVASYKNGIGYASGRTLMAGVSRSSSTSARWSRRVGSTENLRLQFCNLKSFCTYSSGDGKLTCFLISQGLFASTRRFLSSLVPAPFGQQGPAVCRCDFGSAPTTQASTAPPKLLCPQLVCS